MIKTSMTQEQLSTALESKSKNLFKVIVLSGDIKTAKNKGINGEFGRYILAQYKPITAERILNTADGRKVKVLRPQDEIGNPMMIWETGSSKEVIAFNAISSALSGKEGVNWKKVNVRKDEKGNEIHDVEVLDFVEEGIFMQSICPEYYSLRRNPKNGNWDKATNPDGTFQTRTDVSVFFRFEDNEAAIVTYNRTLNRKIRRQLVEKNPATAPANSGVEEGQDKE
jgi:hypothetical protein